MTLVDLAGLTEQDGSKMALSIVSHVIEGMPSEAALGVVAAGTAAVAAGAGIYFTVQGLKVVYAKWEDYKHDVHLKDALQIYRDWKETASKAGLPPPVQFTRINKKKKTSDQSNADDDAGETFEPVDPDTFDNEKELAAHTTCHFLVMPKAEVQKIRSGDTSGVLKESTTGLFPFLRRINNSLLLLVNDYDEFKGKGSVLEQTLLYMMYVLDKFKHFQPLRLDMACVAEFNGLLSRVCNYESTANSTIKHMVAPVVEKLVGQAQATVDSPLYQRLNRVHKEIVAAEKHLKRRRSENKMQYVVDDFRNVGYTFTNQAIYLFAKLLAEPKQVDLVQLAPTTVLKKGLLREKLPSTQIMGLVTNHTDEVAINQSIFRDWLLYLQNYDDKSIDDDESTMQLKDIKNPEQYFVLPDLAALNALKAMKKKSSQDKGNIKRIEGELNDLSNAFKKVKNFITTEYKQSASGKLEIRSVTEDPKLMLSRFGLYPQFAKLIQLMESVQDQLTGWRKNISIMAEDMYGNFDQTEFAEQFNVLEGMISQIVAQTSGMLKFIKKIAPENDDDDNVEVKRASLLHPEVRQFLHDVKKNYDKSLKGVRDMQAEIVAHFSEEDAVEDRRKKIQKMDDSAAYYATMYKTGGGITAKPAATSVAAVYQTTEIPTAENVVKEVETDLLGHLAPPPADGPKATGLTNEIDDGESEKNDKDKKTKKTKKDKKSQTSNSDGKGSEYKGKQKKEKKSHRGDETESQPEADAVSTDTVIGKNPVPPVYHSGVIDGVVSAVEHLAGVAQHPFSMDPSATATSTTTTTNETHLVTDAVVHFAPPPATPLLSLVSSSSSSSAVQPQPPTSSLTGAAAVSSSASTNPEPAAPSWWQRNRWKVLSGIAFASGLVCMTASVLLSYFSGGTLSPVSAVLAKLGYDFGLAGVSVWMLDAMVGFFAGAAVGGAVDVAIVTTDSLVHGVLHSNKPAAFAKPMLTVVSQPQLPPANTSTAVSSLSSRMHWLGGTAAATTNTTTGIGIAADGPQKR